VPVSSDLLDRRDWRPWLFNIKVCGYFFPFPLERISNACGIPGTAAFRFVESAASITAIDRLPSRPREDRRLLVHLRTSALDDQNHFGIARSGTTVKMAQERIASWNFADGGAVSENIRVPLRAVELVT